MATHEHLTPPVVDVVLPVYDEVAELESSVRRLHAYLRRDFPFSFRIRKDDR